jgi:hypothetical protein
MTGPLNPTKHTQGGGRPPLPPPITLDLPVSTSGMALFGVEGTEGHPPFFLRQGSNGSFAERGGGGGPSSSSLQRAAFPPS